MEGNAAGRPAATSPSLDDRILAHLHNARATDEVDLFYRRVMADAELEPFFRHIDMSRQRHKLANFMRYILGGAEAYTGRDIWSVHKDMVERQGLRRRHFDLVLQHMEGTLSTLRAPPDVAAQAVAVIRATLPQFRFPPEEAGGEKHAAVPQAGVDDKQAAVGSAPGVGKARKTLHQAGKAAAAPTSNGVPVQAGTRSPAGGVQAITAAALGATEAEKSAPQGGNNGGASSGIQVPQSTVRHGASPAPAAQKTAAAAGGNVVEPSAVLLLPTSTEAVPPPASKAAPAVSASEAGPLLDPAQDPSLTGSSFVQRRLLLGAARENWALLSAGLLAGPQLGARLAVWLAAAALVGGHLAAAMASPPGSN